MDGSGFARQPSADKAGSKEPRTPRLTKARPPEPLQLQSLRSGSSADQPMQSSPTHSRIATQQSPTPVAPNTLLTASATRDGNDPRGRQQQIFDQAPHKDSAQPRSRTSRRKTKDMWPLDFYGDDMSTQTTSASYDHAVSATASDPELRQSSAIAPTDSRRRDSIDVAYSMQSAQKGTQQTHAPLRHYGAEPPAVSSSQREPGEGTAVDPSSPVAARHNALTEPLTPTVTQSSVTTVRSSDFSPSSPGLARIAQRAQIERYLLESPENRPKQLPSFERPHRPAPAPPPSIPLPPLPLPDFIAPAPAAKQRYVSAGGNAKLKDRPEIVPPTLNSTPVKIDVADLWPQVALLSPGPTPARDGGAIFRMSDEENRADSQRVSSESDGRVGAVVQGEKRGRTASGASMRDKIKRVFASRKNSESEAFPRSSFSP